MNQYLIILKKLKYRINDKRNLMKNITFKLMSFWFNTIKKFNFEMKYKIEDRN